MFLDEQNQFESPFVLLTLKHAGRVLIQRNSLCKKTYVYILHLYTIGLHYIISSNKKQRIHKLIKQQTDNLIKLILLFNVGIFFII